MKMNLLSVLSLFSVSCRAAWTPYASPTCPLLFDGRVPINARPELFDTTSSPFDPVYVKGANLSWSDVLRFPKLPHSRFDGSKHKAIEVTIDDRSIFLSGGTTPQNGFRRAELILNGQNGTDASNMGIVTFHWSVRADPRRPLNYTHEYQCVWHERNDFTANQFEFETGTLLDGKTTDRKAWKMLNETGDLVWQTQMDWNEWQNFAVTFDYAKK
jgi:hypothetical protein